MTQRNVLRPRGRASPAALAGVVAPPMRMGTGATMGIATVGLSAAARVLLADALILGPEVWDQVLSRSGAASPFLTWAWHRACAEALPADAAANCRAVVLRGATGDVEAVFPFRVQRAHPWGVPVTELGWAFGDLGSPDHLDLLASPKADLDALVGALDRLPWGVIRLANLAEDGSNVDRFCEACDRHGWTVRRRPIRRCPYLELPESWDAYLSSLSSHGRHAIRRKERKLRREHHVALTDYGQERIEEGLRHLERLHAQRWDGGGALSDPVIQRLHSRFAASLAERGQLWLVSLDLDGSPAAAWYGFTSGDTVYHYQSGRDPRWERDRVGTVLVSLMIRQAIERGYRRLDFLRGDEAYKREWTQTARQAYEIVVFRGGWHGSALRALESLARTVRRWLGPRSRPILDRLRRWLPESR